MPSRHTGRRCLPHDPPSWIDPAESEYFLTVCCQHRGANQLCLPGIGEALLSSARFYYDQRRWYPFIFLLMPDHVHLLASFGRTEDMNKVVTAWKRHAATRHGITWQRGFFEHRLRGHESAQAQWAYIQLNPVRAGLVAEAADWPYVWIPD